MYLQIQLSIYQSSLTGREEEKEQNNQRASHAVLVAINGNKVKMSIKRIKWYLERKYFFQ